METIYDVFRLLVNAAGGQPINDQASARAHEIIDAADPAVTPAAPEAAPSA